MRQKTIIVSPFPPPSDGYDELMEHQSAECHTRQIGSHENSSPSERLDHRHKRDAISRGSFGCWRKVDSCPNSKGRYFEEFVVTGCIDQYSSSHSESELQHDVSLPSRFPGRGRSGWGQICSATIYPSRTGRSYKKGARYLRVIACDRFRYFDGCVGVCSRCS